MGARQSAGADVASEDIVNEHTLDSEPDSEDSDEDSLYKLDSDDEIDDDAPPETPNDKSADSQHVLNNFKMTEVPGMGITHVQSAGPTPARTQDFWHQIIEQRIPTVLMCCDFFKNAKRVCGQYIPEPDDTEQKCGIYTIERVGKTVSMGVAMFKQQLVVYRTDQACPESSYKHKVLHFQFADWDSGSRDDPEKVRQLYLVYKELPKQPNQKVLMHGAWFDYSKKLF